MVTADVLPTLRREANSSGLRISASETMIQILAQSGSPTCSILLRSANKAAVSVAASFIYRCNAMSPLGLGRVKSQRRPTRTASGVRFSAAVEAIADTSARRDL